MRLRKKEPRDSCDQPLPTPNDKPSLWDEVINDMKTRDTVGRARYGTPLQPHNGRNALVDIADELLDALVYLKQLRVEAAAFRVALVEILSKSSSTCPECASRIKQITDVLLQNPWLGRV